MAEDILDQPQGTSIRSNDRFRQLKVAATGRCIGVKLDQGERQLRFVLQQSLVEMFVSDALGGELRIAQKFPVANLGGIGQVDKDGNTLVGLWMKNRLKQTDQVEFWNVHSAHSITRFVAKSKRDAERPRRQTCESVRCSEAERGSREKQITERRRQVHRETKIPKRYLY